MTTFPVGTLAFFAKDLTTPEWAPIMTFACRFVRCSVFSDLLTSTVRRFKAWKSSSSAPAPVPVPKTAEAVASTEHMHLSYSGRQSLKCITTLAKPTILRQVGDLAADLTTSAVRIYAFRLVLWTCRCYVPFPRANEACRVR